MPSENLLASLPDVEELRRLSQSLAMLDAIMSPAWELRYYSFNSQWGEGEMMASMRNGCGDDYFILFNSAGAIIKGFAHESVMTPWELEPKRVWPGVLDDVPPEFEGFLREPAFDIESTTFCLWRRYSDDCWQTGRIAYPNEFDPDGANEMLQMLCGNPNEYLALAKSSYGDFGESLSLQHVLHIYQHQSLSDEFVAGLNELLSLDSLQEDMAEIGYPSAATK